MTLKDLPITAEVICCEYGGWIVGTSAKPDADIKLVNDIDIIVPHHQWRKVGKIAAAAGARVNKHGGCRFVEDGVEIDVWPDTLANNMIMPQQSYVWYPKLDIRFGRCLKRGD
jgi:hypothetical protein